MWCCYPNQTREHLFKVCPEWKAQQKVLWAEVRKETGRWKDRWKIRDLLADERCSRAVLDFLKSTDVGRRVPAEEDAVSEVSEVELREFLVELGAEVEEPGAGGTPLFLPTPDFMASAGTVEVAGTPLFCLSSVFHVRSPFFSISLVRSTFPRDRLRRRAKGSLQRAATARTADRKRTVHNLAMI